MRYSFFLEEEHPRIFRSLESYSTGILAQRSVRNIRYFDGVAVFTRAASEGNEEFRLLLKDDEFDIESYDLQTRSLIAFVVRAIAKADELDQRTASANYATQFALTAGFRNIQSSIGGKRYIAICRDMVDANMSKCLQPYMYEDLVTNMFVNFNKSIGKDMTGLMDAFADYLEELHFNEEELRRIYTTIGNKGSSEAYHYFALRALKSSKLGPALRKMIVDAYSPIRFNGRENSPYLTPDLFPYFSEDELCALLETLPRGMKDSVIAIFEYLGPKADAKFPLAYNRNVAKDTEVLMAAPCFNALPPEIKGSLTKTKVFSPRASNLEIIHYFESLENEAEKEQIYRFCEDFGKTELQKALLGKDFVPNLFSLADLVALASHVSYNSPVMAPRIKSYLSRYVSLQLPDPELDKLFLLLQGSEFLPLIQTALFNDAFHNPAVKLILAERFGLLARINLKEWKYHD